jgi:hypothetical protein
LSAFSAATITAFSDGQGLVMPAWGTGRDAVLGMRTGHHRDSFGHSLLVRLDQGVHDRTVWIALALTAVIVVVMSEAVWLAQEWAFHRGSRRR